MPAAGAEVGAGVGSGAEVTVFIDGLCPLCRHEAKLLSRLDKDRGRLALIDIAAPGFDAGAYGRTQDEFMGSIHALGADGSMVTGMEVFRRAYAAVGWGWLWAPTGWPGLRWVCDRLYRVFARVRPYLRRGGASAACESDRCRVPGA